MEFYPLILNISADPLVQSFFAWQAKKGGRERNEFLRLLYAKNVQDDFSAYLYDKIVYDENAFSVACAEHKTLSPYLENAFVADLEGIRKIIADVQTDGFFRLGSKINENTDTLQTARNLRDFYAKYGFGDFIRYCAFKYEKGGLRPLANPSPIRLTDLKNYADEKRTISANIENFLSDLPYSNMLLYGERGTGKSSTVHAMLNEYFDRGLRLVELSKEDMLSIAALKELLQKIPLKFILYIDDLSLNSGDERISSLKAALEGCSEGNTKNAMIVATSNRRHIIDEKFSQRNDSVHAGDSMQEELSLSDRFGIAVLFSTTNKEQYLSIVRQLADDVHLCLPQDQLFLLAERWAIQKGGRSPRRAKQFVDLAFSFRSKGKEIEF